MKCSLSGCPNDGEHEITVRLPKGFPDTTLLVCESHYGLMAKGLVSGLSIGGDGTVTDTL